MTNNLTVKIASVLLLLLGVCSTEARVVLSKGKQEEFLNTARLLLSAPSDAKKSVPDVLHDPFHIIVQEVPETVAVAKTPEVEAVRDLSESEILSLAALRLKPSGFIDQGGQQYLILNGKKVQDGAFFNFPHEKKRYAIEINRIQNNSFTLNLNSESKTISME